MTERVWAGAPPKACDLCGRTLSNHFFDARTRHGPWACLCPACFGRHGVGLGVGCGQEYRRREDGRFVKVVPASPEKPRAAEDVPEGGSAS